jgi:hypothetical protein
MTVRGSAAPLRLLAVGDIFLDRPDPATTLKPLRDLLRRGDVVFGNSEGVYSDSPERAPNARGPQIAAPGNARALGDLGFGVLSLANNHIVDGGYTGLEQTAGLLAGQGIRTTGAGRTLAEALAPAVVDAGGTRIAFLAFSSVFPGGYEARPGVPGLAPLRSHTFYADPNRDFWNPGAAPQIIVAIDDGDSEAAEQAVRAARETADLVVASVHWGDVSRPYALTDHEPQAAQLLVDAGVDLVLGHHQHTLRGIGFVDRVPVAYGLGHVACDLPRLAEDLRRESDEIDLSDEDAARAALGDFGIYPRAGFPLLPFPPDARRTVVARFDLDAGGIVSSGVYPCRIQADGGVLPIPADDPALAEDLDHLRECQAAVPGAAEITAGSDEGLAYWRLTDPAGA